MLYLVIIDACKLLLFLAWLLVQAFKVCFILGGLFMIFAHIILPIYKIYRY